jgi:hypothetical protein
MDKLAEVLGKVGGSLRKCLQKLAKVLPKISGLVFCGEAKVKN